MVSTQRYRCSGVEVSIHHRSRGTGGLVPPRPRDVLGSDPTPHFLSHWSFSSFYSSYSFSFYSFYSFSSFSPSIPSLPSILLVHRTGMDPFHTHWIPSWMSATTVHAMHGKTWTHRCCCCCCSRWWWLALWFGCAWTTFVRATLRPCEVQDRVQQVRHVSPQPNARRPNHTRAGRFFGSCCSCCCEEGSGMEGQTRNRTHEGDDQAKADHPCEPTCTRRAGIPTARHARDKRRACGGREHPQDTYVSFGLAFWPGGTSESWNDIQPCDRQVRSNLTEANVKLAVYNMKVRRSIHTGPSNARPR